MSAVRPFLDMSGQRELLSNPCPNDAQSLPRRSTYGG
jgi:hypothetical protein